MNKIYLIIAVIASIAVNAFLPSGQEPTKDQCVAYWTERTANWANQPSYYDIVNDETFCG